jgi:hypothetical protein
MDSYSLEEAVFGQGSGPRCHYTSQFCFELWQPAEVGAVNNSRTD